MTPDEERTIVDLIGKRFISHGVHYAEQEPSGAYHPVKGGLTRSALSDHLSGKRSLGHYLVSPEDSHVKLVAFDLDARKALSDVEKQKGLKPAVIGDRTIEDPRSAFLNPDDPDHDEVQCELWVAGFMFAHQLKLVCKEGDIGVTCAVAFSGSKGVHVYGWFDQRQPAKDARTLAQAVLTSFAVDNLVYEPFKGSNFYRNESEFPCVDVEIFPKQETVGEGGSGNLMRLPLGINLKNKGRSYFMAPGGFGEMDTLAALEGGCIGR